MPRSRTALAALTLAAALGVATVLGAAPASGCSLLPETATATPGEIAPGGTVTIAGTGIYWFDGPLGADCSGLASYVGTASLVLVLDEAPYDEVDLGTVEVDADSAFDAVVAVPDSTPPGTYQVQLHIEGQRYPTSAQVTVAPPATTTTAPPTTAPPSDPADPVDVDPSYTG